jgi:hypothetical protein
MSERGDDIVYVRLKTEKLVLPDVPHLLLIYQLRKQLLVILA